MKIERFIAETAKASNIKINVPVLILLPTKTNQQISNASNGCCNTLKETSENARKTSRGRPRVGQDNASSRTKRRYRQQAETIVKNKIDELKQTVTDLNQSEQLITKEVNGTQFEKVS